MKLTARQSQVLDIIRRYVDETGYPPTRLKLPQSWDSVPPTRRKNI